MVKQVFTTAPPPDLEAAERGRLLFAGPCDFLKGVVAMDGLPPADRLEVCFAGRSNVGKSSLINALTGRKGLARASNTPGRTFGLHAAMPGLQALFNQGKAAIVANVGPLLAPTTREDFRARRVPIPPDLYSHSDQQAQWQSAISDGAPRSGWGGRLADLVRTANGANPISIIVPCHRVIGRDGSLTGYAGGLPRKQQLLELEGVLQPAQAQLAL